MTTETQVYKYVLRCLSDLEDDVDYSIFEVLRDHQKITAEDLHDKDFESEYKTILKEVRKIQENKFNRYKWIFVEFLNLSQTE